MRLSMIAETPGCTNGKLRENLLAFNFAVICLLKKFSSFLQGQFGLGGGLSRSFFRGL